MLTFETLTLQSVRPPDMFLDKQPPSCYVALCRREAWSSMSSIISAGMYNALQNETLNETAKKGMTST